MPFDIISYAPEGGILEIKDPRVDEERRRDLEREITDVIEDGVSQRADLNANLILFGNLYEQRTFGRDFPWPDASDVFVPLVPSVLDTTVSRILENVTPQRLLTVRGRTPSAAQAQWTVEQWYNKQVVDNSWRDAVVDGIFLTARDGTAILETVWDYREHSMKALVYEQELGAENQPLIYEDGRPRRKAQVKEVRVIEFNNPRWNAVELRDFYIFPAWARNIEEAPMVGRIVYFTENQLDAMAHQGEMIKEEVEWVKANYQGDELPIDQDSLPSDSNSTGAEDYSLGGQLEVTPLQQPSMKQRKASYFKFWRIHTNMFDLSGDGEVEENIIWYHHGTQRITGIHAAKYLHGKRPFERMVIMPRPNRFYGWGIPERLASLQLQINSIHNQRNDQIDIRTSPPLYIVAGVRAEKENMAFAPMQKFYVTKPDDVGIISMPEVLTSTWQEEAQLFQYAQLMMGLFDPAAQSSSGRTTRYQAQMLQTFISIRVAMMSEQIRETIRRAFWQTHQLMIQYGPQATNFNVATNKGTEELTVTKEMLAQDYELGVNGQGSPLDKRSVQEGKLFVYNLFMQNPLVSSDLSHVYALSRSVLETFEEPLIESIIGTPQEAMQMEQARRQAAQKQQQLQELAVKAKLMYANAEMPRGQRRQQPQRRLAGGTEGAQSILG